jgi:hypothetical protein
MAVVQKVSLSVLIPVAVFTLNCSLCVQWTPQCMIYVWLFIATFAIPPSMAGMSVPIIVAITDLQGSLVNRKYLGPG